MEKRARKCGKKDNKMGLIVQHDELISGLKNLDIYKGDELIIYTTLKTHQPFYTKMNYLALDNYIVTGVWLALNEAYIHVFPVNQLGKLKREVITIPRNDISSLNIKKNLLVYTITIKDIKGNIVEFRALSRVLGNKKHHEDFMVLIQQLKK